jgi:hypothetical protein
MIYVLAAVLILGILFLSSKAKKSPQSYTVSEGDDNADLPAGYASGDSFLQELYDSKKISKIDFEHYNRFSWRSLGFVLVNDNVVSVTQLPSVMRKIVEDEQEAIETKEDEE